MSTIEQVQENIDSASRSGIGSLTDAELDLIAKAKKTYEGFQLIPCTNCGYCIPCPEGVDIPRILKISQRWDHVRKKRVCEERLSDVCSRVK